MVRFQVVAGAAGRVLTVVARLLKGCQLLFATSPGGPLMETEDTPDSPPPGGTVSYLVFTHGPYFP
jgi:hypothetical protein